MQASPIHAPVRLDRLDGLRGLAACGVAFTYHAWTLFADGAIGPVGPVLEWFQHCGWLFVDMFFVLSGYIFAHVYLGHGSLKSDRDLADFAVARIARLYPLHLVMLLVTAVLFWGRPENNMLAFGAHLLMLQGVVKPVAQTFDGPTWSLTVEAACYVLFAFGAAAGPRGLRLVTGFSIGIGVLMIASHASAYDTFVRDNFPRGLLGFFLGQVLWHQRAQLARVPSWALVVPIVVGFAIPPTWAGAILPLALVAFPAALLLGLRLRMLGSRPLIWLGDRSYAIYLIHVPLRELVLQVHGPFGGDGMEIAMVWIGFIATTLALADLSLKFIENPARRAIRAAWERRGLAVASA